MKIDDTQWSRPRRALWNLLQRARGFLQRLFRRDPESRLIKKLAGEIGREIDEEILREVLERDEC
jgi:hypothetical protein